MRKFFSEGSMHRAINYIRVTLLLKSLHVSSIKQYRPISYYYVLYKVIAKTLAKRLQGVIGDIISPEQSGSIPNK